MTLRLAIAALAIMAGTAAGVAEPRGVELVMFDDQGCVWCRRWDAEVGPGYPHSPEGQQAPLRRVNIRDQSQAGIALTRPITGTPTFVLVQAEQEVGRIAGYPGADFFYPRLTELLRRLPPMQPVPGPVLRSTLCAADACRTR